MPATTTKVEQKSVDTKTVNTNQSNSISAQEYSDQMSLSLAQLETVTLMLQVLNQADGGQGPTE
jgi:hypothetical protein